MYNDQEVLKMQREIPPNILQQLIKNIIEGEPISNIKFNMKMYADFSIVHSLVREFSYLPFFLSHALSSTDPLEKMKSIVSYSIASKHLLNSHKAALEPTN